MPHLAPPTKIQLKAIPCLVQSQVDIIAQVALPAEAYITYALSVVQFCLSLPPETVGVAGMIVTATVERASWAHQICQHLGMPLGIRSALAVSRNTASDQQSIQRTQPHILIGTPQVLLDLLALRAFGSEGAVKFVVLDEADLLVTSSAADRVVTLMRLLPNPKTPAPARAFDPFGDNDHLPTPTTSPAFRITCIFGATIPPALLAFAESSLPLREPVRVLARKAATVASNGGSVAGSVMGSTNGGRGASHDLQVRNMRHYFLYVASKSGMWYVTRTDACFQLLDKAMQAKRLGRCAARQL